MRLISINIIFLGKHDRKSTLYITAGIPAGIPGILYLNYSNL